MHTSPASRTPIPRPLIGALQLTTTVYGVVQEVWDFWFEFVGAAEKLPGKQDHPVKQYNIQENHIVSSSSIRDKISFIFDMGIIMTVLNVLISASSSDHFPPNAVSLSSVTW